MSIGPFQIVVAAGASIGLGNASALLNTWMAASDNAVDPSTGTVYSGGTSQRASGIGTLANEDILQTKLDRNAGTVQFGKNNTFGSVFSTVPAGALLLAATGGSGLSIRVRTETRQFSYAVPSGFAGWN